MKYKDLPSSPGKSYSLLQYSTFESLYLQGEADLIPTVNHLYRVAKVELSSAVPGIGNVGAFFEPRGKR